MAGCIIGRSLANSLESRYLDTAAMLCVAYKQILQICDDDKQILQICDDDKQILQICDNDTDFRRSALIFLKISVLLVLSSVEVKYP